MSPSECTILFAIPTDEETFREHARTPHRRDYVVNRVRSWPRYHYQFVRHFTQVERFLRSLGVTLRANAALTSLTSACSSSQVVIVFAHWTREGVELDDGVTTLDAFVEAVPNLFGGILDLCVCHPLPLVLKLRTDRRCLIRFAN